MINTIHIHYTIHYSYKTNCCNLTFYLCFQDYHYKYSMLIHGSQLDNVTLVTSLKQQNLQHQFSIHKKFSRDNNYWQWQFRQLAQNTPTLVPERCAKNSTRTAICVEATIMCQQFCRNCVFLDVLVYWFSYTVFPIEQYCNYSKGSQTVVWLYFTCTSLQAELASKDLRGFMGEEEKKNRERKQRNGGRRTTVTCLGCKVSRRSRPGTHSDLWCGGTALCCAHTVGMTGCSGAHRNQEGKLSRAKDRKWRGGTKQKGWQTYGRKDSVGKQRKTK